MAAPSETVIRRNWAGDLEAARFGHAVRWSPRSVVVVAWGDCDAAMAWRLRDCLDSVVAQGHPRVALDVGEMRFVEFTAVAILTGALTRAARHGIDVALQSPDGCGRTAQILHTAHLRAPTTSA